MLTMIRTIETVFRKRANFSIYVKTAEG